MKALGRGSIASLVEAGLTIAWYVLWACLAALALVAVVYGAVAILAEIGVLDASILPEGQGGIIQLGNENDVLRYSTPGGPTSWQIVIPALVIGAVVIVGALVIIGRLRRLFNNFTSGEPFRRENADHLRVIWIAMLCIEIARYVLLAAIGALLTIGGLPEGARADFNIDFDISTWMSIAVLVVLAEVFREGARMKEEQELTI